MLYYIMSQNILYNKQLKEQTNEQTNELKTR
jgi:hypothetical protein